MNDGSPRTASGLIKMIADYMEKGFLDNIVDMFRHDPSLYDILPGLITDERLRVRLGTTALVECLREDDKDNVCRAVPVLLPFLNNENPNIRGDVANLIGLLGNKKSIPDLEKLLEDPNQDVRFIAREAIEDIRGRGK